MRRQEWGLQNRSHLPFLGGYHSIRRTRKVATLPRRDSFSGVQRLSEGSRVRPLPQLRQELGLGHRPTAEHLAAGRDTGPGRTLQDCSAFRDVNGFSYPGAGSFQEATGPNRFSGQ